jgi:hypothetical protein
MQPGIKAVPLLRGTCTLDKWEIFRRSAECHTLLLSLRLTAPHLTDEPVPILILGLLFTNPTSSLANRRSADRDSASTVDVPALLVA